MDSSETSKTCHDVRQLHILARIKAYKVDVTKAVRVAPKEAAVVVVVLFDQESVWCSLLV